MRISFSSYLSCAALAVLGAAFTPSALSSQSGIKDSVLLANGKRIRGVEVTEMSGARVKWKRGEELDERPAMSVASVTWHNEPEPLTLARAAMKSGRFEDAVPMFEDAIGKTDREFVKLEAQFLGAQAVLRAAGEDAVKAGNAAAKLREFLAEASDSYWAAQAQLLLGQAELAAGNAPAAETALSELSGLVASRGLPPIWDIRAKFAIAKAQLAQDKLAEARSSFRRTKNAATSALALVGGSNAELVTTIAQSIVGEGETFIAEKKFDEAIRYFETLARNSDSSIAAAAKAGKGQSLYLRAEASNKKDDLRTAQILLAEANLADPLGGATSAKALYYSGKVLLALGAERESQDFQVRANEYFKTVAEYYADTAWAARAASELQ